MRKQLLKQKIRKIAVTVLAVSMISSTSIITNASTTTSTNDSTITSVSTSGSTIATTTYDINEIIDLTTNAINAAKASYGVAPEGSLLANEKFLSGASSTTTDWFAMAISRFGYIDKNGNYLLYTDTKAGIEAYLAAMEEYVTNAYEKNGGYFHKTKVTEYQRASITIDALGGNSLAFGKYGENAINLVADGTYNHENPAKQGLNGLVYALLAMNTLDYEVPANANYTEEDFILGILQLQVLDENDSNKYAGWSWFGNTDVDMTAMTIQALAPYYQDATLYTYTNTKSKLEVTKTVKQAIDEALTKLAKYQKEDGDFASMGTPTAESTAQVVVALTSLGINPQTDDRFITASGKTLIDGIMKFKCENGGFAHIVGKNGNVYNQMANQQVTYALVSAYRQMAGMNTLYDMRNEEKTSSNPEETGNTEEESSKQEDSTSKSQENEGKQEDEVTSSGEKKEQNQIPIDEGSPQTWDNTQLVTLVIATIIAMGVFVAAKSRKEDKKNSEEINKKNN